MFGSLLVVMFAFMLVVPPASVVKVFIAVVPPITPSIDVVQHQVVFKVNVSKLPSTVPRDSYIVTTTCRLIVE